MTKLLTLQWESPTGKPSEDVVFTNDQQGVFVVADGVSRRGHTGAYPNPSPARLAAEEITNTIGGNLSQAQQIDESTLKKAWKKANNQVRQLNQKLGLWENCDYWVNDFAGAVASCLVIQQDTFLYGFIGDCGVAQLSDEGELLWHTPNEVRQIESYILPDEAAKHTDKLFHWRKEYRNNPGADHATYGVLTGEEAALEYVRIGTRRFNPGELLVVYSDGIEPSLYNDPVFRKLLAENKKDELQQYVEERSTPEENKDEKTVIVLKF